MDRQQLIEMECKSIYEEAEKFFSNLSLTPFYGYKILNAPPIHKAPILFLGYQPGGDCSHWQKEKALSSHLTWPLESEYGNACWPLAKFMRGMLEPEFDLKNSVGTNAIFLRYPNVRRYKQKVKRQTRKCILEFSLQNSKRIIDLVEPQRIIVVGLSTLNLFGRSQRVLYDGSVRTLARVGAIEGREALGILHLTGARISTFDRGLIGKIVRIFLKLGPAGLTLEESFSD